MHYYAQKNCSVLLSLYIFSLCHMVVPLPIFLQIYGDMESFVDIAPIYNNQWDILKKINKYVFGPYKIGNF